MTSTKLSNEIVKKIWGRGRHEDHAQDLAVRALELLRSGRWNGVQVEDIEAELRSIPHAAGPCVAPSYDPERIVDPTTEFGYVRPEDEPQLQPIAQEHAARLRTLVAALPENYRRDLRAGGGPLYARGMELLRGLRECGYFDLTPHPNKLVQAYITTLSFTRAAELMGVGRTTIRRAVASVRLDPRYAQVLSYLAGIKLMSGRARRGDITVRFEDLPPGDSYSDRLEAYMRARYPHVDPMSGVFRGVPNGSGPTQAVTFSPCTDAIGDEAVLTRAAQGYELDHPSTPRRAA